MNFLKAATSAASAASKAAPGLVASIKDNAMNNAQTVLTGQSVPNLEQNNTGTSTSDMTSKPPELTNEEKKDEIRKAYREIILKQEEHITSIFKKGLESYMDTQLVDNDKLKIFIQDSIFSQMNEFFKNVNTAYVQYAFIISIFTKHEERIKKSLETSIMNASIPLEQMDIQQLNTYTANIIKAFQEELKTPNVIYGGGGNEGDGKLAEIVNWFPLDYDKDKVSSDIEYIVKKVISDTLKNDREFANTIKQMMTRIFKEQIENIIQKLDIQVDISILHSYINLPESNNILYISILNVLTGFTAGTTTASLAVFIYNEILKVATQKYQDETNIYKIQVNGGGRKTRRNKKRRVMRMRSKKNNKTRTKTRKTRS
jgi:hypothetical protein